jgi:hypothetical protein
MNDTQQIQDATNWLMNLGAVPFTVVACIIIGYVFRFIPIFPNKWIPIVVIVVGPVVFPCLNPHAASVGMAAFIAHSIVGGLFLGIVAWLIHDKFIQNFEDKITAAFPAASIVLTSTQPDGTKTFTKPTTPDSPAQSINKP